MIDTTGLNRRLLESSTGYAFDLDSSIADAERANGLATSAHAFLTTAVNCQLVGLNEAATALSIKATEWLVRAISINERPVRYFMYGSEALRFYDLATARWLVSGDLDELSTSLAADNWIRYIDSIRKIDKPEVTACIPALLAADRRIELLRLFELAKVQAPKVGRPLSSEFHVAYAWIATLEVNVADLLPRYSVFHRLAPLWINGGRSVRVAHWANALYRNSKIPSSDAINSLAQRSA